MEARFTFREELDGIVVVYLNGKELFALPDRNTAMELFNRLGEFVSKRAVA